MKDNVNTLTLDDTDYPSNLKDIPKPPAQLFWIGKNPKKWISRPKVAIVGSRRCTPYGRETAYRIASDLARAGVVIISGLAFGIDVAAHQGALAAGGTTAAVLATPLNKVSPVSHLHVAEQIAEQGTLISEYQAGAAVNLGNFVIRNRIISGLSDIVLIPEAVLKSGALHTARFALEQGKTVMAVPGNINSPASEGSNNLIKSGAVPATSADDVFFALNINPKESKESVIFRGSRSEEKVINLIRGGLTTQEQIALTSKLDAQTLSSTLTMLEINGHIRPLGGGSWTLA